MLWDCLLTFQDIYDMWLENKKTGYKRVCEVRWPLDLKDVNAGCVGHYMWIYRKRKKSGKSYIKILIMVISGGGIMDDFYVFLCVFCWFFCLCVLHMELKHNKSYL